jgi:hypothetical protein
MYNALPATKQKFLAMRNLPLNENLDNLSLDKKEISIEMNKLSSAIRNVVDKIDYDSVASVPVSESFINYKLLPTLNPIKVNGESLENAQIIKEGNEKIIERLELYKDTLIKMYEEAPLITQYVTLSTDLLILNHKGHILTIQKYIDDNSVKN